MFHCGHQISIWHRCAISAKSHFTRRKRIKYVHMHVQVQNGSGKRTVRHCCNHVWANSMSTCRWNACLQHELKSSCVILLSTRDNASSGASAETPSSSKLQTAVPRPWHGGTFSTWSGFLNFKEPDMLRELQASYFFNPQVPDKSQKTW